MLIPCIVLALFLSPSPSLCRNVDPGPLSRLFSPRPDCDTRLLFCQEQTSALYSLIDSHRIAPTHAATAAVSRSQQFFSFDVFSISANRLESPTQVIFEPQHQLYLL